MLMGLGVSVAVAEWCAARGVLGDPSINSRIQRKPGAPWEEANWLFKSLGRPADPDPEPKLRRLGAIVPPEWASAYARASQTCPGKVLIVRQGAGVDEEVLAYINIVSHGTGVNESMIRRRAGWPLRCLAGTGWNSSGFGSSERWIDAIATPNWFGRRPQNLTVLESNLSRRFLLEPIPIGLAVNSVLYAVVLSFLWAGWHRVVGALRRRRNRCVGCNYDRAGLGLGAPCPECGFSGTPNV